FEVWSRADMERHREEFSRGNPVWKTSFEAMGKKTVIRSMAKYIPQSPEFAQAMAIDATADEEPQENWSIINAEYEPAPVVSEDAETPAQTNAALAKEAAQKNLEDLRTKLIADIEDAEAA